MVALDPLHLFCCINCCIYIGDLPQGNSNSNAKAQDVLKWQAKSFVAILFMFAMLSYMWDYSPCGDGECLLSYYIQISSLSHHWWWQLNPWKWHGLSGKLTVSAITLNPRQNISDFSNGVVKCISWQIYGNQCWTKYGNPSMSLHLNTSYSLKHPLFFKQHYY